MSPAPPSSTLIDLPPLPLPSHMRRFILVRHTDATGVSGTGTVAEGVQFTRGWVSLTWLTPIASVVWYPDIHCVQAIHGHDGGTEVVWLDSVE